MTAHEWKVLASFGLLVGAISLYDPSTAKYVVTIAVAVIIVRNADKIPIVRDTNGAKKTTVAPTSAHALYV